MSKPIVKRGLADFLKCMSRYGYGSGWHDMSYCEQCCDVRETCYKQFLQLLCEKGGEVEGEFIEEVAIEENRLNGLNARREGAPDGIPVRKQLSEQSIPRRRRSGARRGFASGELL